MIDHRDELPGWEFDRRAEAVYWGHAPACGSKGPDRASCLREPNHGGAWCEGNGYDDWGPKYRAWSNEQLMWL